MEFNIVTGFDSGGYKSFGPLYSKLRGEYTPGELKKLLTILLDQMPSRVQILSDHIFHKCNVRIEANSSDDVLDRLPQLIASLGGLRMPTKGEVDIALLNARPRAKEALTYFYSSDRIDDATSEMIFDGGLLWGEAFRARFPLARWAMGRLPKSSIYYGFPVLIGQDRFKSEFHPAGQLSGMVTSLLENKPEAWSLSRRMVRQATDLGYR